MQITKKVLKNCEDALKYFNLKPEAEKFVKMREKDGKYIDWWVERGNWYYGNSSKDSFVYWDGASFGFTFGFDLLEEKEALKELKK